MQLRVRMLAAHACLLRRVEDGVAGTHHREDGAASPQATLVRDSSRVAACASFALSPSAY